MNQETPTIKNITYDKSMREITINIDMKGYRSEPITGGTCGKQHVDGFPIHFYPSICMKPSKQAFTDVINSAARKLTGQEVPQDQIAEHVTTEFIQYMKDNILDFLYDCIKTMKE